MIYVDSLRCNGCGDCLKVCPQGAISMEPAGVAFIDEALCQHCELCVEFCPEGAILVVEAVEMPGQALTPAPEAVVRVGAPMGELAAESPNLRELAAPAVGAALLWTGRHLLPRVADLLMDLLERRSQAVSRAPLNLAPGSRQPLASSKRALQRMERSAPGGLGLGRDVGGGRGGRRARRRSRGG